MVNRGPYCGLLGFLYIDYTILVYDFLFFKLKQVNRNNLVQKRFWHILHFRIWSVYIFEKNKIKTNSRTY